MSARTQYLAHRNPMAGYTTVELLVATVMGLVLIAATTQIFVSSKQVYRLTDALSRVQENGRFALEILGRDVRITGHAGCRGALGYEDPPLTTGVLTAGLVRNALKLSDPPENAFAFGIPVQGYNANGSNWSPALDTSIDALNPLEGTDILTVRGVEGEGFEVVAHPGSTTPGASDITIRQGSGVNVGDILLISDCYSGAIFEVTGKSASGTDEVLTHTVNASGTPGNQTTALGKSYAGGEVSSISTRTYFIKNGVSGRPSLWRKVGSDSADELVEGVDDMQILYGQDTDGDQVVDLYEPANDVGDWDEVVAVRISLLVSGAEDGVTVEPQTVVFNGASSTAADKRIRQVFTTTVALRNKLP